MHKTCLFVSNYYTSKKTGVETKTNRAQANMNLAWLSYWWKRMERETVKDRIILTEEVEKKKKKFAKFFDRKQNSTLQMTCSAGVMGQCDVINECHPVPNDSDVLKERHPTVVCDTGHVVCSPLKV